MGCTSSRSIDDYDDILHPLVRARALESTIRRSNYPPPVQPPEMARRSVDDVTRAEVTSEPTPDDASMSLEDFTAFFSLPQRAKVVGGYWEADDGTDSSREFAADEVIQVTQVVCPFVSLLVADPESENLICVSLSTRFQNVRFRVISSREFTRSAKPRVYRSVGEMVDVWPHTVKALAPHRNPVDEEQLFNNGDRLRLVRIACLPEGRKVLECKLLRGNMRLLQLPLDYRGNFAEVDDPKGYTLHDLVSIARVPRTLKIHRDPIDQTPAVIPGIPTNFDGYITLEKPRLFVHIQRVPLADGAEAAAADVSERPFLVPIDCPIDISLRENNYQGHDFGDLKLKEMVRKYAASMPFVARITDWTEETSILQLHLVRPGHQLVIIREEARSNVLVRDKALNRQYLVPVDHAGSFVRLRNMRNDGGLSRRALDLKSLEDASFPFDVRYTSGDKPYSNLSDGVLPTEATLAFEAFVDGDETVVVAKLADGGLICKYFHLPLRTGLRLQFERRWTSPLPADGQRWSDQDSLAESVNAKVYNELMKIYSDYEWVMVEENSGKTTEPVASVQPILNDQNTLLKSMKDFAMSADGYLKPYTTLPPVLRPRSRGESLKKRSKSGLSPTARRRYVPPPPTAPRKSAPPLPSRATRISFLSTQDEDRTDSLKRDRNKPLPPPPPPTLPPPHPHPPLQQSDSNDDDDSGGSSQDNDAQSYSYIDVETLEDCVQYRQKAFPGSVATDGVSIPSDGNVSNFTADQMLLFLREVHAPVATINAWRQLRISGRDFAKMTDERLEEFCIQSIVVQFFRDRSRMHVLSQL